LKLSNYLVVYDLCGSFDKAPMLSSPRQTGYRLDSKRGRGMGLHPDREVWT